MNSDIEILINDNPEKIPNSMLARAKSLSPSLLSDAMGSLGAMGYSIKPVKAGMKVAGTAVTVKVKPGDNLFLHKSIYLSGRGYVLVLDSGRHMGCAVWGSMMTRAAAAMGLEGVVLDGAVRDLEEISELGLPVFAAGAVPNGPTTNGPGCINDAISCGGTSVAPGDLVLGDDDGVVVVPRGMLESVLEKAEEKAKSEEIRINEIKLGKMEPDWVREKVDRLMRE